MRTETFIELGFSAWHDPAKFIAGFAVSALVAIVLVAATATFGEPSLPYKRTSRRETQNTLPAPIPRSNAGPLKPTAVTPAATLRAEHASLQGKTILFVDVETTGLSSIDRIVSFGAVKLSVAAPGEISVLHLIFNPERKCARSAIRVHGYTSKTLARQDSFDDYAAPLRRWFEGVDLIVAHNAAFDLRFLHNAFANYGLPGLTTPIECTMRNYRDRGEGPASLDAIASRLGIARDVRHGALHDAWICMQAFLWMRALPWRLDFGLCGDPTPANFRPPQPRRNRASAKPRRRPSSNNRPYG